MSVRTDRWGVMLLAHGAPDKLDDIPEFLLNIRHGRPLPPPVVEEIKSRYALIGGGSPLLKHTRQQAEALANRLGHPVYIGMRNWRPFIADTVKDLLRDRVQHLVALCMAPQNSRTSVGLYRSHLETALKEAEVAPTVTFVDSWHDNHFLTQAFAERLRAAMATARETAQTDVPVILTAHSVPERTIAGGDPYDQQVQVTAAGVAAEAGCPLWFNAYQSQGMTDEAWIGPTVESVIDKLAADGQRHVLVAPIGFLCDHVEILYDVDVLFRQYAEKKGLRLWRTESLNESSLLTEALASIVEERVGSSALSPAP